MGVHRGERGCLGVRGGVVVVKLSLSRWPKTGGRGGKIWLNGEI